MLIEQTLFGERDMVATAITRLKEFEKQVVPRVRGWVYTRTKKPGVPGSSGFRAVSRRVSWSLRVHRAVACSAEPSGSVRPSAEPKGSTLHLLIWP